MRCTDKPVASRARGGSVRFMVAGGAPVAVEHGGGLWRMIGASTNAIRRQHGSAVML